MTTIGDGPAGSGMVGSIEQAPRPGRAGGAQADTGRLVRLNVRHLIGDLDPPTAPGPARTDVSPRSVALERLALGAAIAGRAQAGWAIDAAAAVRAGASWEQVAPRPRPGRAVGAHGVRRLGARADQRAVRSPSATRS